MLFILSWTLTLLLTYKPAGFYLKYLKLCSEDEQSFFGVETTFGQVNNDKMFHVGVETPFKQNLTLIDNIYCTCLLVLGAQEGWFLAVQGHLCLLVILKLHVHLENLCHLSDKVKETSTRPALHQSTESSFWAGQNISTTWIYLEFQACQSLHEVLGHPEVQVNL